MIPVARWTAALLPLACLAAACGEDVVVDPSGQGGAGGAPTTSTSTSTSTVSSTSTDVTTTSTGSSGCEHQGDCGDDVTGCIACALGGPCGDYYTTCLNPSPCMDYITCINPCASDDTACLDQCKQQFPEGSVQYEDLFSCVYCQVCAADCPDPPSPGCP
jgi:hypothetical protein